MHVFSPCCTASCSGTCGLSYISSVVLMGFAHLASFAFSPPSPLFIYLFFLLLLYGHCCSVLGFSTAPLCDRSLLAVTSARPVVCLVMKLFSHLLKLLNCVVCRAQSHSLWSRDYNSNWNSWEKVRPAVNQYKISSFQAWEVCNCVVFHYMLCNQPCLCYSNPRCFTSNHGFTQYWNMWGGHAQIFQSTG